MPSFSIFAYLLIARTGHTLTRLGETKEAVLFGGVMEQEERKSFSVEWELACRDGNFYILDLETFIWRRVPVPSTLARTYHTAECLETVRSFVVAFVGGVMHDKNTTTRIPINEVLLLTMNSQDTDTAVLSTVTLAPDGPSTPVPYISYHATAQVNYNILVSGGFQLQHSSDIPKTSRHASSRVFILDIVGKKYKLLPKTQNDNQFGTAGHVLLTLAPDCIISVGGTSKQISMLTDRKYEPEKCDLLPLCTIAEAEETVEIQWVQCETPRCRKWVHVYCLKLNSIPEIYFCPHCRNKNEFSVCVCSIHLKTCRIHLKKCTIPN